MPLAYYSRSATAEFWSEHWGSHSVATLLEVARRSPLTAIIERHLPPRGLVLEAGCGLGQYVLLLRERGRAAVGADWSLDALREGRRAGAPLAAMTEFALAKGAEVFGSIRWRSKTENIDHLRSRIGLIECDLRDLSSVRNLLETSEPTHIVHLAAQSFVAASWKAPAETLSTNITAQVNLLEAMRGLKIAPRFLAIGSSEEYGLVHPDELPIKETNPLRPLSPYAVSKVTQDMASA